MFPCREIARSTPRSIESRPCVWSSIPARPVAHVAAEIGVGEQLLGRWVAAAKARSATDNPEVLDDDERAELQRLRKENAELRLDRAFLKKAAAFFASEQNR